ncbi:hypothetical protein BU16DRAFT_564339 [Lophium mytilinum]|uniref:Uncharacterized protein n=1 Tax=Lophium mytilinum TaxID=390894 RepID=A0A6A6QKR3_9PEZI|nr:hypothetical protein BU16DRAFT_564339 [Lophium mytilinum]
MDNHLQAQTSASNATSPPATPSTPEPFFPNGFTPYPFIPPFFRNPFDNGHRPERVPSIMKSAAPGRHYQQSPPKRDRIKRLSFSIPSEYPWEEPSIPLPSLAEFHGLIPVTYTVNVRPGLLPPPGFPLHSAIRVEDENVHALSVAAEERLRLLRKEVDERASQMLAGVAPDQLAAALQEAFDSDTDGRRPVYRRRRRGGVESRRRVVKEPKLRNPHKDAELEQEQEAPALDAYGENSPPNLQQVPNTTTPERVGGKLPRDALLALGRLVISGKKASRTVADGAYERLKAEIPADLKGLVLKPRAREREREMKEVTWWDQAPAPAEPGGGDAAQVDDEAALFDTEGY